MHGKPPHRHFPPFRPHLPFGPKLVKEMSRLVFLWTISEEPEGITGYELQKNYKAKQTTVYRALKSMEEKGLLAGLLNKNREFLGLSVISEIDYKNRILKMKTSWKDEISIVQLGQVKIDEAGKELGITTAFSIKD